MDIDTDLQTHNKHTDIKHINLNNTDIAIWKHEYDSNNRKKDMNIHIQIDLGTIVVGAKIDVKCGCKLTHK